MTFGKASSNSCGVTADLSFASADFTNIKRKTPASLRYVSINWRYVSINKPANWITPPWR
jgi:hypothetical protein